MANANKLKVQLWVAWTGPIFLLGFIISWGLLGRNIPPFNPAATAKELADFIAQHRQGIFWGQMLAAAFSGFYLPWSLLIGLYFARIEGDMPILSLIEIVGGAITAYILCQTSIMWSFTAYSPSYSPSMDPVMIQTIHDAAWYNYHGPWLLTTLQMVCGGIVILMDKSETPLFPRWSGWLGIVGGLSFVTAPLIVCYKTGPLSIVGWYNFWTIYTLWLLWFAVWCYYLIKDIRRQMRTQK